MVPAVAARELLEDPDAELDPAAAARLGDVEHVDYAADVPVEGLDVVDVVSDLVEDFVV